MVNFKYSEPYISPKGYKDKEGKTVTKWFIRYKIEFEEKPINGAKIQYRKEYGGSYNRNINSPTNHKQKIENAEALLGRVIDDLTRGIDPSNREIETIEHVKREIEQAEQYKVEYVFNQWFASKNYINPIPSKVLSAEKYKGFWLNQFIPYLETIGKEYDIRKVNTEDIDNWFRYNYDNDKWTARTIDIKIGLLSGVFKFAFKKRFIKENPMTYVTRIVENKVVTKNGVSAIVKKREARFNILTQKEQDLIYKYLDLKNEAIAKTLGFGFIRFSEIYRLKLEHLDLNNWMFHIPADIAKGQRDGSTASVKIYPKLQEVLTRYLNEYFGADVKPEYYLFYNITKLSPSSYSILQHYFNNIKSQIETNEGVKINKTPYCFKHTGAKSFIEQNKAKAKTSYQIIEAIMKLMRHSDFKTSQKYIYNDLGINLDADDDFTFD